LAIFLVLAALVISLLASIKPYAQYKKAYENNIFKNNLIDSLAHNMKTPLQILGGYAENLKDVTSDAEKDRYADQILAKTNEMNKDIEAILKTAEKTDRKFTKASVRTCLGEVAEKLGVDIQLKGDMQLKMDKDYFETALYCLLDNASKYKKSDSKIEVDITSKAVTIRNQTGKEKFTPGTGIAIAGRILEQHKLQLCTVLKDGVFEAKFGKKLGKK
jgi:K+-sensing histidine kinase KdpD